MRTYIKRASTPRCILVSNHLEIRFLNKADPRGKLGAPTWYILGMDVSHVVTCYLQDLQSWQRAVPFGLKQKVHINCLRSATLSYPRQHIAMRLSRISTVVQLMVAAAAAPLDSIPSIGIDPAVDPLEALAQLQQHAYNTLEQADGVLKRGPNGCSLANTAVRRDW